MKTQSIADEGPGELLTPPQAAARTGIKEATLANMRCRGDGPRFHKVSKFVRYDSAELDRWMRSRTYQSTAQVSADAQAS